MEAQQALTALSKWVDQGNPFLSRSELALHRTVVKLSEEVGEVAEAIIGATGANPRKGVTNDWNDVLEELLDVAITALGAYEHVDGHQGRALSRLDEKIQDVALRAELVYDS